MVVGNHEVPGIPSVFGQTPKVAAAAFGVCPSLQHTAHQHGAPARLDYAASIVHSCERSFGVFGSRFVAEHQQLQSVPNG